MKKIVVISLIALTIPSLVKAESKHSITAGYAQGGSKTIYKIDDLEYKGKAAKGLNAKYRYEFDKTYGVITSLSYLKASLKDSGSKGSDRANISDKTSYTSLLAGPTYRFNEYASAYGMMGVGHFKSKTNATANIGGQIYEKNSKNNKTTLAYAAGMQFNPGKNVVLDLSFERASGGGYKMPVWVAGIGYTF